MHECRGSGVKLIYFHGRAARWDAAAPRRSILSFLGDGPQRHRITEQGESFRALRRPHVASATGAADLAMFEVRGRQSHWKRPPQEWLDHWPARQVLVESLRELLSSGLRQFFQQATPSRHRAASDRIASSRRPLGAT